MGNMLIKSYNNAEIILTPDMKYMNNIDNIDTIKNMKKLEAELAEPVKEKNMDITIEEFIKGTKCNYCERKFNTAVNLHYHFCFSMYSSQNKVN